MDNTNEEVVQLYLDDIIPNRFQPREVFDDQALKELAVSIREHGVIQPILVRKFGEKYEIIAGERRYKASTMAGLTKIPAIIKNLDDKEASKVALIENLQRRDLTPVEEARTYQKILDLDQMTQEQLAKTMGKSQSAVSNKLRLLTLPDEVQEALLNNRISERHARSLLNAPKSAQVSLLKEVIEKKMTVRELDNRIKAMLEDSGSETDSTNGGMNNVQSQNNIFNGGNIMNNYDPTAVDINKIREQSSDINAGNNMSSLNEPKNIDSLLLGRNAPVENNIGTDRFIPNNTNNISNNSNENEALGGGLLAGMPVIQEAPNNVNSVFTPPVIDSIDQNNQTSNNVEPNLFEQQVTPTENENPYMISGFDMNKAVSQNPDNNSGLFSDQLAQPEIQPTIENQNPISNMNIEQPVVDNNSLNMTSVSVEQPIINNPTPVEQQPFGDISSLFSTPAPEQIPIKNDIIQQPMNTVTQQQSSYSNYGSSKGDYSFNLDLSNIQIPKDKIEEMKKNKLQEMQTKQNNQQLVGANLTDGVAEIKNVVTSLTNKGFKVSVDELNLDNEVQLIVKFVKG